VPQGKLEAFKEGRNWLSSKRALEEYIETIVNKGISDYETSKTKKLDFSKSIHEQLMGDYYKSS
jgi:hypothetical protein